MRSWSGIVRVSLEKLSPSLQSTAPVFDARLNVVFLVPVYNDWESVALLLQNLDDLLVGQVNAQIVLLDDCSSIPAPARLFSGPPKSLEAIHIVRLRRNLGHQRAIAIGLSHLFHEQNADAVVVMDADGEDKPEDAIRLIDRFRTDGGRAVVFAERARRSEDWFFRFCYKIYCALHRALTGIPVRIGNFSILSRNHLSTLVVVSETWNHYAASVLKAKIPCQMVPTSRGKRLAGQSQLNFVSLVIHGLSAISVFAEVVGVRIILVIIFLTALISGLIASVIGVRLWSELAIPGWATSAAGILLIIVLQMLTVAVGLTLSVLFNRNNLNFLPIRDFQYFIAGVHKAYERPR